MAQPITNLNPPDTFTCKVTGAPIEIRRMRDEATRADRFEVRRRRWAVRRAVPTAPSWVSPDPYDEPLLSTTQIELPERAIAFEVADTLTVVLGPGQFGGYLQDRIERAVRKLEQDARDFLGAQVSYVPIELTPEGAAFAKALRPMPPLPAPKPQPKPEPVRTIGHVKRRLAV